jgi:hypothetical protein
MEAQTGVSALELLTSYKVGDVVVYDYPYGNVYVVKQVKDDHLILSLDRDFEGGEEEYWPEKNDKVLYKLISDKRNGQI